MRGSYNVVDEQLKDSYKREKKPVHVVSTGDEYDVLFRRSSNKNTTKNYGTIFYFKTKKELKQGRLLLFRNKYFLVLNQEEIESDVYYRSEIAQTNCVLESLINKRLLDGKWYADELVLNAFSSDMKSNATINDSVISILGGHFDIMTEDNAYTRLLEVGDIFSEFGGRYEIDGIYFLEGIAHIALKRTVSSSPSHTAMLNPIQNDFYSGYEYNPLDFVSPIVRETNESNSSDYIIGNATIDVVSSDESIAKLNPVTGIIETYAEGEVTFTFTWVERGITIDKTYEILPYVEPQSYTKITYSGPNTIRVGGSPKTIICKLFSPDGTEITDYANYTFVWTHDMIPKFVGRMTITYPARNQIAIKMADGDDAVGTLFNVTIDVTEIATGDVLMPDVAEFEIIELF